MIKKVFLAMMISLLSFYSLVTVFPAVSHAAGTTVGSMQLQDITPPKKVFLGKNAGTFNVVIDGVKENQYYITKTYIPEITSGKISTITLLNNVISMTRSLETREGFIKSKQGDVLSINSDSSGTFGTQGVYASGFEAGSFDAILSSVSGVTESTNSDSPIKVSPLTAEDDMTYLTDFMTLEFFKSYLTNFKSMTYTQDIALVNTLSNLSANRWYSKYLTDGLSKISKDNNLSTNVNSISGLITYIRGKFQDQTSNLLSSLNSTVINNNYVVPILKDNILSNSYISDFQKYQDILYSLTITNLNKDVESALYADINSYIGVVSEKKFVTENNQNDILLNKVLTKISEDSSLNSNNQVDSRRLYSIVEGRGSVYSDQSSNPMNISLAGLKVTFSNTTANNYAKQQALNINSEVNTLLKQNTNNNQDISIDQMYTINLRLQYHYWAMQTTSDLGVLKSDTLSTTGSNFIREISPITFDGNFVVNQKQYIEFMNAANEIPVMRDLFMKQLSGNILSGATLYGQMIDDIVYLRQLKNSITFLQTIDTSKLNVSPIIDYWYSQVVVDSKGDKMSLEDLYNRTQSLNIDVSKLNPYKNTDVTQPLSYFFDDTTYKLNDYIKMGISESATYIPLKTNVYNASTYRNITNQGFYNFQYQWGYYRKALYIDEDVHSAVDRYTSGKKGKLRVATLNDLLHPEGDITLYIDPNFYNVNKLAAIKDKTINQLNNQGISDKTNMWSRIWQWATQVFSIDITEITKTGSNHKYSSQLEYGMTGTAITQYSQAVGSKFDNPKSSDANASRNYAVFGKTLIDRYTQPYQPNQDPSKSKGVATYSVLQPFAFVSAVYRDTKLFNFLNSNEGKPVFMSSKDLYGAAQASTYDKDSLLNYALLKNIKSDMMVGYQSNLDLHSPLYMDVYGNILTESGYVVVPAAANATLQDTYDPYTAAFLSTYGSIYKLPDSYKNVGTSISGEAGIVPILTDNTNNSDWEFKNEKVGLDTKVDINQLSTGSESAMNTLYQMYWLQFNSNFKNALYIANVFMEVVRGAPIEDINKAYEGLNTGGPTSRAGIVHAVKLDQLKKDLNMNSENVILALPNLAFVSGIEYVIFYTYKAVIILAIIMILVQIFVAAMKMKVGLQTVLGMILILAMTLASVFTVPLVFSLTYYQANKYLLQSDTEYIAMLNYEKEQSGVEIGMTSVGAPTTNTKLLLKVTDVNIPWYNLFYKIIYAPIDSNMQKIYKDAAMNDLAMQVPQFHLKDNTLYMSMDDLLNSSNVMFESDYASGYATLYQTTKGDVPASFYTPYYAFLDALIGDVNTYNAQHDIYAYTTKVYAGSRVKSIGLIKAYFTSDEFIKNPKQDLLHLRQMYGLDVNGTSQSPFSVDDIDKMRQSQWLDTNHTSAQVTPRIDKISEAARAYVLNNKDLLGKVSDETFLKVMALHLAMLHNKLFGINGFQNIDIYNLSVDDLMRLSVAPRATVMQGSPLSYTRFIYDQAGDPGIYLSAVYNIVVFLSSWIKPLVTLVIFLVLFISLFVYKVVLRRKSDNIAGYFKLFGLICSFNVLYALLIKVTLWFPSFLTPALCLLVDIVLQMLFLGLYVWVAYIASAHWRDLGSQYLNITSQNVRDFFFSNADKRQEQALKNSEDNPKSGWRKYKKMKDDDKIRKYVIRRRDDV